MSHTRTIFKAIIVLNCSFRAPAVPETEEKPGFISSGFFPSPVPVESQQTKLALLPQRQGSSAHF